MLSPKKFAEVYLEGLYPLTFRQAVSDTGPEDFDSVCLAIYTKYDIFDIISLHSTTITSSNSEGKVADVAIHHISTDTLKCPNCNMPKHKPRDCRSMCTLCPGLAPHKYFKTDFCRQYKSMEAFHKKNGTWVERRKLKANNANITVTPPSSDPSEISQMIKALDKLTSTFTANVSKHKRLLMDSGCNTNIIASPLHSDIPIIYRDSKEGISTANGEVIPIIGQGSLLNIEADYVPTFVDSLFSVSQTTSVKDSCFIFLKDIAYNICLNPSIINLLSQIHTLAVSHNLILCTANLSKDKLYEVNTTQSTNHIPMFAASTYYQTAKFDNVPDVIKYFHETWSHASMDLMIHIIKHNIFTNLPPSLTESAIRKYFPICPSCSAGNMNRRPY